MVNLLGLGSSLYSIQVFNRYIGYGLDGTLIALTVGAILAIVLEFVFRSIRAQLVTSLLDPQDARSSYSLLKKLLNIRADAQSSQNPQYTFQSMKQQQQLQQIYSSNNMLSLMDLPFAIIFIGAVFLLHSALGVIVSLAAASSLLLAWWWNKRSQITQQQVQQAQQVLDGNLNKTNAHSTIHSFNAAEQISQEFQTPLTDWMAARSRQVKQQLAMQQSTQLVSGLTSVAVIGMGAVAVSQGFMDIGSLIGANILAMRGMNMINGAARTVLTLGQAEVIQQQLDEVNTAPQQAAEGATPAQFNGNIAIRGVTHSYDARQAPFLNQFNLQVKAGDSIAVCGSNGRGKTTVAKIVMGLLAPQQGQVLVDGIDLRQLQPQWWRKQVVFVPQEPVFVNGTLNDNLNQLCWPDVAPEERVKEIITQCGLQALIDQHPDGLNQKIVANGANMPLGIRKRIALARALMADGKLLLLDEPHEGMDALGRTLLSNVISAELKRGKTLILLSSDKSTVGNQINVFDLNTGTYTARGVKAANA